MGVVDYNRIWSVSLKNLVPAGEFIEFGDTVGDSVRRDAEKRASGRGRGHVVYVEFARKVGGELEMNAVLGDEGLDAGAVEDGVVDVKVSGGVAAIGDFGSFGLEAIEIVEVFVVAVEDDVSGLVAEDIGLGGGIVLHVVVIIEMILGEVGHDGHEDRDAEEFLLVEGLASGLDDTVFDTLTGGLAEEFLEDCDWRDGEIELVELALPCDFDNGSRKH